MTTFAEGESGASVRAKINATIEAVDSGQSDWNAAYGWGDHSAAGYLTSVSSTDVESAGVAAGFVLTANGSGEASWTEATATTLQGLANVTINSPSDNEVLSYSGGTWANQTAEESGLATLDAPSFTGTVSFSGAVSVGAAIVETVFTLTGTTPSLDPSNGTIQEWSLTGNSSPTDALSNGESMTLLIDDGAGYTITWPAMEWVGGSAPTLDTTNTTIVVLVKAGGTLIGNSPGVAS